jgi:hypothetical protein
LCEYLFLFVSLNLSPFLLFFSFPLSSFIFLSLFSRFLYFLPFFIYFSVSFSRFLCLFVSFLFLPSLFIMCSLSLIPYLLLSLYHSLWTQLLLVSQQCHQCKCRQFQQTACQVSVRCIISTKETSQASSLPLCIPVSQVDGWTSPKLCSVLFLLQ